MLKTLNESIEKLNDILVLSAKEETAFSTSNNNALAIKRLSKELVRTKRGFLEEKAARKQDKETIINILKKEIASVILRTDAILSKINALTTKTDFTTNETVKIVENLADDVRNLANKIEGQELHSAAYNSQAIPEYQAVMEQNFKNLKDVIMKGHYFQNATLQFIAKSFKSSISTCCDEETKYSVALLSSLILHPTEVFHTKVRLVGGSKLSEGRVELLSNGAYGTVCDDNWNDRHATVVCRMLGYNEGTGFKGPSHSFGEGIGEIFLDNVHCTGSETSLFDCSHNGIGVHDCGYHEDAGVSCT